MPASLEGVRPSEDWSTRRFNTTGKRLAHALLSNGLTALALALQVGHLFERVVTVADRNVEIVTEARMSCVLVGRRCFTA